MLSTAAGCKERSCGGMRKRENPRLATHVRLCECVTPCRLTVRGGRLRAMMWLAYHGGVSADSLCVTTCVTGLLQYLVSTGTIVFRQFTEQVPKVMIRASGASPPCSGICQPALQVSRGSLSPARGRAVPRRSFPGPFSDPPAPLEPVWVESQSMNVV